MFYTVANAAETSSEKTITINNAAASDTILSVTQVKICDDPKAAFAELNEEDFSAVLSGTEGGETPDTPEGTTGDEPVQEVPDTDGADGEGGFFEQIGNTLKNAWDTAVDAVTGFFGSLFRW